MSYHKEEHQDKDGGSLGRTGASTALLILSDVPSFVLGAGRAYTHTSAAQGIISLGWG